MYAFNKVQRQEINNITVLEPAPNSNLIINETGYIDLSSNISVNDLSVNTISVDNFVLNNSIQINNLLATTVKTTDLYSDNVDISSAIFRDISVNRIDISSVINTTQANIINADISNAVFYNTSILSGDNIYINDISVNDISANNALINNVNIISGDISINTANIQDASVNNINLYTTSIYDGIFINTDDISANYMSVIDLSVTNLLIENVDILSGNINISSGNLNDLSINDICSNNIKSHNIKTHQDPNTDNISYITIDTSSDIFLWHDNNKATLTRVSNNYTLTDEHNHLFFNYPIKSYSIDEHYVIVGQPTFETSGNIYTGQSYIYDLSFNNIQHLKEDVNHFGRSVDIDNSMAIVASDTAVFIYDVGGNYDISFQLSPPLIDLSENLIVKIKNNSALICQDTDVKYIFKENDNWNVHSTMDYSGYFNMPIMRDDAVAFDGTYIITSNDNSIFIRDISNDTTAQQIDISSTSFNLVNDYLVVCDYIENNSVNIYKRTDISFNYHSTITDISDNFSKRGASINSEGNMISISNKDGLNSNIYKWFRNTWNLVDTVVTSEEIVDLTVKNVKCIPEVSSYATNSSGELLLNESTTTYLSNDTPDSNTIYPKYFIVFQDTSTNLLNSYPSDISHQGFLNTVTDISANTIFERNTNNVYDTYLVDVSMGVEEKVSIPSNKIVPKRFFITDMNQFEVGAEINNYYTFDRNGNQWDISISNVRDISYGLYINTYVIKNIPKSKPIAIVGDFTSEQIEYTGSYLDGYHEGGNPYYYGTITLQVHSFFTRADMFVKGQGSLNSPSFIYTEQCDTGLYLGPYDTDVDNEFNSGNTQYLYDNVMIKVIKNYADNKGVYKYKCDEKVVRDDTFKLLYETPSVSLNKIESIVIDNHDLSSNNIVLFNNNMDVSFGYNLPSETNIKRLDFANIGNHMGPYSNDIQNNIPLSSEVDELVIAENVLDKTSLNIGGSKIGTSYFIDKIEVDGISTFNSKIIANDISCTNIDISNNLYVDGDATFYSRIIGDDMSLNNIDISDNLNVYGSHNISSDKRIKNDVIDISGIQVVTQLKPKFYIKNNVDKEAGFIAQDILDTDISYCVKQNDTLLLNYNTIFTYGIKAIQELNDKFNLIIDKQNDMESKINELCNKINNI